MTRVTVPLKKLVDNSYNIDIGYEFISDHIYNMRESAVFFIVDSNVYKHNANLFDGYERMMQYSATEENKNLDGVVSIVSFLRKFGCNRSDVVVGIGGGNLGDIVGFASSIYMRGIDFMLIPTTLLSMVDSSVGGKTGIHFDGAKNNLGAFKQPRRVLIDTKFLQTLSNVEILSGLAEVIKYGLMFDTSILSNIKENSYGILKLDAKFIDPLVTRCCQIKSDVVVEDELETGLRMQLNYGHTIGHAIETDSHYEYSHGLAVAIGMYLESLYLEKRYNLSGSIVKEIEQIYALYNYQLDYKVRNKDIFAKALKADKKASKKGLTLTAPKILGVGEAFTGIDPADLVEFIYSL